jgi:hypothetical protein
MYNALQAHGMPQEVAETNRTTSPGLGGGRFSCSEKRRENFSKVGRGDANSDVCGAWVDPT